MSKKHFNGKKWLPCHSKSKESCPYKRRPHLDPLIIKKARSWYLYTQDLAAPLDSLPVATFPIKYIKMYRENNEFNNFIPSAEDKLRRARVRRDAIRNKRKVRRGKNGQDHGKKYEKAIREEFNLNEYVDPLTGKTVDNNGKQLPYDAISHTNLPIQIKNIKKGRDVDLADYFRNVSRKEDFGLVVGFYEKDPSQIEERIILIIPGKYWADRMPPEKITTRVQQILLQFKGKNAHKYDPEWREASKNLEEEYSSIEDTNRKLLKIGLKRDSKIQLRAQGALSYVDLKSLADIYDATKIFENWKEK